MSPLPIVDDAPHHLLQRFQEIRPSPWRQIRNRARKFLERIICAYGAPFGGEINL